MSSIVVYAFPCQKEPFLIPGAVGQLEVLTHCPEQDQNFLVIVCHPHPLYGGSMQNKVVHTLDKTFHALGAHVVRFNFRGVGQSDGDYDEGDGEVDDLHAVVQWCQQHLPDHRLCLAGFSFGAYIAMRAVQSLPVELLVCVAPPVNIFDFSAISEPSCPWIVVQGDADEIVDAAQVVQWSQQFQRLRVLEMAGAGHFFHAKLNLLQQSITGQLIDII